MSMPEFPNSNRDTTQEQALTMILSSIASEEEALSRIINAQSDKLQYILNQASCCKDSYNIKDILAVNKSVTNLLEMVMQNQMILKSKMEAVLEHLPPPLPSSPDSPCTTIIPCPLPPLQRIPICNCKCKPACRSNIFIPIHLTKIISLCFIGRFKPFL